MNNVTIFHENEYGEAVDPIAAIVLCSIAAFVSLVLMCATFFVWPTRDCRKLTTATTGLCSFLVAITLFLTHACLLREWDKHDYEGRMRVTGVKYEVTQYSTYNDLLKRTDYFMYYNAVYSLDWGYEWACPAFSDSTTGQGRHCQSVDRACPS